MLVPPFHSWKNSGKWRPSATHAPNAGATSPQVRTTNTWSKVGSRFGFAGNAPTPVKKCWPAKVLTGLRQTWARSEISGKPCGLLPGIATCSMHGRELLLASLAIALCALALLWLLAIGQLITQ